MGFTYIHNPATLCDADIKLVGDFMEMRDSFDVVVGGKSITSGLLQHATKICEMHLRQEKFQNELTKREFERIYKELKLEADAEIHAEQQNLPSDYYDWTDTMEKLWNGELYELRQQLKKINA